MKRLVCIYGIIILLLMAFFLAGCSNVKLNNLKQDSLIKNDNGLENNLSDINDKTENDLINDYSDATNIENVSNQLQNEDTIIYDNNEKENESIINITDENNMVDKSMQLQNVDHIMKDEKNEKQEYNIMLLSAVEGNVFKEEIIIPKSDRREKIVIDPEIITISIGSHDYEVMQRKIIYSDERITDEYCDENGNIIYQIDRNNDSFYIAAQNNTVLQKYETEELTEHDMVNQIKDLILSFVPNEQLDKYIFTCDTNLYIQNVDSAWRDKKNFFYTSTESNEIILNYTSNFRKISNNLETSDRITVQCDKNGNVVSIEYINHRVDWDTTLIYIDDILKQAENFIANTVSEKYSITRCILSNESLTFFDSKVCVVLQYELTLKSENSEIVVLCPLIIIP